MNFRTISFFGILVSVLVTGLLGVVITSAPLYAGVLTHDESFVSTAYRDSALTTAVWDTIAAEVRLPTLGLDAQGTYNTAGNAFASAVVDSYLLIADGADGLVSLDISDPATPVLADIQPTLDQARDIALQGNLAVLAIGTLGLQIIDVSTPLTMVPRGDVDTPGYTTSVALNGNLAYLAQSNFGVAVVDIANPDSPVLLQELVTRDWARGVAVAGSALAVADGDSGLTMLDLSIPAEPSFLAGLNTAGTVLDVTVAGNRAYLAAGAAGLIIVDISNPAAPVELGSYPTIGTCRHVAVSGDSLYVAAGSSGLYLLNASDPAAPTLLERADTLGEAYHTTLDQNVTWLSDGAEGVHAYVADPLGLDGSHNLARSININPTGDDISHASLASDYSDSIKFELSVNGGATWSEVTPDDGGIDFSPPGADLRWRASLVQTGPYPGPILRSLSISFTQVLQSAEITGITDLPGDTGGQVRIVWAASPHDTLGASDPVSEYSVYRRYWPDKTYPPGSWDYLLTLPADTELEYSVVAPTLADSSSAATAWTSFFIRARTNTVGVFYDSPVDSGYSVNNLQPSPPTGFQAVSISGTGYQLDWDPSSLTDFSHFAIYRSAVPNTPVQPGTLLTVSLGTSLFDATADIWFYQLTVVNQQGQESEPMAAFYPASVPSSRVLSILNYPNPFNPITDISFEVPDREGMVQLDIYDARGRLVRSLVHENLAAGPHHIRWDGLDNNGHAMSSGVYAARLQVGHQIRVLKMSLVR